LSGWAIELHLVRGGRVILKAIIALNRKLASGHIEHHVPEPAAIVFISERYEVFELSLQMGGVAFYGFVLAGRIPFAVIALHFFRGSIVAVTVEVHESSFGRSLSWLKGLVIVLLSVFHRLILPIGVLKLLRFDLLEEALPRVQPHYRAVLDHTGPSCGGVASVWDQYATLFQL
jgi:hypothetical protein